MNILTLALFCYIQLEEEKKKQKTLGQTTQHRKAVSAQKESLNQEKHVTDYLLLNRNFQCIHYKMKLVKETL